MIPIKIESIEDVRVEKYRNIKSTRISLLQENMTIGESEILLMQALISKARIISIILSEEYYLKYKSEFSEETEILIADPSLIKSLADYNLRNPILFILSYETVEIENITTNNHILYLNAIFNFENIGAIIRNAVAFGFNSIIFDSKSCNPYHHRALVVSRGSTFHTEIIKEESKDLVVLKRLKKEGYKIVSFEITDNSISVANIKDYIKNNQKLVYIFGSEGQGVDSEILELSDIVSHIPMNTVINSINVAASSAIALYLLRESIDLN